MTQSPEMLFRLCRPFEENLLRVTSSLRDGQSVGHPELSSALLLAIRRGNVRQLKVLFSTADPRLLEDSLGEAWRTAGALGGLRLDKDTRTMVRNELVSLRYRLSVEEPEPTREEDPVAEHQDLRTRVGELQQDVQRLEEKLGQLQDGDYADCCVLLAKRCALAMHWLKSKEAFSKTCDVVAWGETEFLLAQFVEAQSEPLTLAIIVATPQRTAAHLRFFKNQLEKHMVTLQGSPAPRPRPEDEKKKKKNKNGNYPSGSPDDLTERLDPDSDHARLRQDFTLLRDFSSLRKITEALEAACKSLDLDDRSWFEWGSLGLRAGLFVAGEAMKNTWQSPNLSCRWTDMLLRMAPDSVKKILTDIRDCQEHAEQDTNATSGFEKRQELGAALKRMLNVARVLLREAFYGVLDDRWNPSDFDCISYGRIGTLFVNLNFDLIDADIITELTKLTDSNVAASEDLDDIIYQFKRIVEYSSDIDSYLFFGKRERRANGPYCLQRDNALERVLSVPSPTKVSLYLVHNLRETDEAMGAFHAYLNGLTSQRQVPLDRTIAELRTALKAIPEEGPTLLIEYAVLGVLREVASRWHDRGKAKAVPTPVPYATALVGRSLRNYLNHYDNIVDLCIDMAAEQVAFRAVLCKGEGVVDLLRGAKPKQCDLEWSKKENERLLRLMELKSTAFKYAREGRLTRLQRLLLKKPELQGVVNFTDCRNRSLLTVAAQAGQMEVVQWLLGLGESALIPLAYDHFGIYAAGSTVEIAEMLLFARHFYLIRRVIASMGGFARVIKTAVDQVTSEWEQALARGEIGDGLELNTTLPMAYSTEPVPESDQQVLMDDANLALSRLIVEVKERGLKLEFKPPRIESWEDADASLEELRRAAIMGQTSMVTAILRTGPPGMATYSKKPGYSGLDAAAVGGQEAVVDLLLQHGARPTPGFTLYKAARSGSVPTVRRLLDVRDPAPPSDEDCWSAAEGAANIGAKAEQVFFVLLDELLGRGLAMKGEPARRLLWCVGTGGSSTIALRLLDCCGPAALDRGLNSHGRSLLAAAAAFGHEDLVRHLLARGADPLRRDDTSRTALHGVRSTGVIDALMEHIDAEHSLRTGRGEAIPPLYVAAQGDDLEAVEALIAHGADVDVCAKSRNLVQVPLYTAAALGHTRVVKCLLEHGAKQIPDPTSDTPLIAAARRGRLRAVKALLASRAPKDHGERERLLEVLRHQGDAKFTALHSAVLSGSCAVVDHLLEREWELLQPTYKQESRLRKKGQLQPMSTQPPIVFTRDAVGTGRTPLMVAVVRLCAPNVTETLLKYMANKPTDKSKMMEFAGKDLAAVCELVMEALRIVKFHPYGAIASSSTARVLIRWLEEKGEDSEEFKNLRSQHE